MQAVTTVFPPKKVDRTANACKVGGNATVSSSSIFQDHHHRLDLLLHKMVRLGVMPSSSSWRQSLAVLASLAILSSLPAAHAAFEVQDGKLQSISSAGIAEHTATLVDYV